VQASRRLVLGLGNPLAGDDGFGPAVIARLRAEPALAHGADLRDAGTDLLGHIDTLAGYDEVVLVDAVVGLEPAGCVTVIGEHTFSAWPADATGCHQISPLVAIRLFRALHPDARTRVTLVALQSGFVGSRPGVAPAAVAHGVDAVARLLRPR
jgi:hydrogenase maturation protease